jgi:hypothetical protein
MLCVPHFQFAFPRRRPQGNRLACEGLGDLVLLAAIAEPTYLLHPAHEVAGAVFQRRQRFHERPRARLITGRRHLQAQRFVRAFQVVRHPPRVETRLALDVVAERPASSTPEEEKLPMKNGFSANLEYFKLEFLDPHEVEMGRQFAAILPILWLMAGAKGPRPYSTGDVPYLIPAGNPFAVLLDEAHFRPFKALIEPRPDLTHIFLVTDSEDAFFDMKAEIDAPNVIMLYKSYLQNFKINTQRP